MIEVLGHAKTDDLSRVFIAWDLNGVPQQDITLTRQQWCDLLMNLGYIEDFHNEGDVAIVVDGQKYWMSFERWVADDMCDAVAKDLVEQIIKKASTTGGY